MDKPLDLEGEGSNLQKEIKSFTHFYKSFQTGPMNDKNHS